MPGPENSSKGNAFCPIEAAEEQMRWLRERGLAVANAKAQRRKAHSLLGGENWDAVSLRGLLNKILTPFWLAERLRPGLFD